MGWGWVGDAAGAVKDGIRSAGDGFGAALDDARRAAANVSPATIGHTALDVVGLVPVVGEVADLANAGWYAAEGNYVDAGLSAASAIPIAGWGATGAKWVKTGVNVADAANDGVRMVDNVGDGARAVDNVADGARAGDQASDGAKVVEDAAPPTQTGGGKGPGEPPDGPGGDKRTGGAADEPEPGAGAGRDGTSGRGRLTGSLDDLTPAERSYVELELNAGRNVEMIPRGEGRTPDFRIDGGPTTELKTISGVQDTSGDGISRAMASRIMDGRGQADHIVVDIRQQAGVTQEIAERGVRRAYGADNLTGGKIQEIRVIGPDFDITVPRR